MQDALHIFLQGFEEDLLTVQGASEFEERKNIHFLMNNNDF